MNNVDFNKFSTKYIKWITEHKDSVFIAKEDVRLKIISFFIIKKQMKVRFSYFHHTIC